MATAGLAGFAASLLVELTQYTGNWFLFPCAYRVADVDDLIANTAGALAGALLALLLRPRSWDAGVDPELPRPVTASRRLLGAVCALLVVSTTGFVLGALLTGGLLAAGVPGTPLPGWVQPLTDLVAFWLPALAFLLVPLVGAGGTVGQRAVRLRPATPDGGVPPRGPRLLRVLLGTGGVVLLSGPSGTLGFLGFVWAAASLVGLFRSTGHRGLAGRITGLTMIDDRSGPARPVPTTRPARPQTNPPADDPARPPGR